MQCIPESYVKIVWHNPMDIPISSAASHIVSYFHECLPFGQSKNLFSNFVSLTSCHHVLKFFPFGYVCAIRHPCTQSLISLSFTQHSVGFCSCFIQFAKFHISSLPLCGCHITAPQNQNHSQSNSYNTTKATQAVWNKLLCVGCSQLLAIPCISTCA
jgi:undecaprenyl pyrophosphate phosphatase UppP